MVDGGQHDAGDDAEEADLDERSDVVAGDIGHAGPHSFVDHQQVVGEGEGEEACARVEQSVLSVAAPKETNPSMIAPVIS